MVVARTDGSDRAGGQRSGVVLAAQLVWRFAAGATAFVLERLGAVPAWAGTAFAVGLGLSAVVVVVQWVRTADWEHDRRVTADGHRTAAARRAEARANSAWVREQRRLVRERRRLERTGRRHPDE